MSMKVYCDYIVLAPCEYVSYCSTRNIVVKLARGISKIYIYRYCWTVRVVECDVLEADTMMISLCSPRAA